MPTEEEIEQMLYREGGVLNETERKGFDKVENVSRLSESGNTGTDH